MLSKVAQRRKQEWQKTGKFFKEECVMCGVDCKVTDPDAKSGFNLGNCPKVRGVMEMVKKDENKFPGPTVGEDVEIITLNNIKLVGKVVGTFDDAIVLEDERKDYQIVLRAAVSAMLIKAVQQPETATGGEQ